MSLTSCARLRTQATVRRYPSGDTDAARTIPPRRLEQSFEQRLNDDALEAVAGGMKQCPGPITGPKDPYNPIPFIPLGPFRW